ncbi:hypothetical protein BS78_09G159200 [Paspalum vaginatum]|nr:hypothetical protein BS78_09G159200 [Paspalum vaginatum]
MLWPCLREAVQGAEHVRGHPRCGPPPRSCSRCWTCTRPSATRPPPWMRSSPPPPQTTSMRTRTGALRPRWVTSSTSWRPCGPAWTSRRQPSFATWRAPSAWKPRSILAGAGRGRGGEEARPQRGGRGNPARRGRSRAQCGKAWELAAAWPETSRRNGRAV